MNSYEQLLETGRQENIIIKEKTFKSNACGLCKGNKIAIRQDIPTVEKAAVLAEELGHYYTTVGDILNQENTANRKQERRARIWAYSRLVSLDRLIDACAHGCCSAYEMAEYLEISETFFHDAVLYYREKYGCSIIHNSYLITFEPALTVSKAVFETYPSEGEMRN